MRLQAPERGAANQPRGPRLLQGTPFLGLLCVVGAFAGSAAASDLDEFKVKREQVFEFAQKPTVTREGDRVTIAFETKGFCDVTVAIEEAETGVRRPDVKVSDTIFHTKIVRHLASGVLGPNAPEPFQKNSKKQSIVWDGKDDLGAYIDDKGRLAVRVSLGLKPRFERTLFWSPHKRIGHSDGPHIAPAPEGVYLQEGCGVDSIRLYDHDGRYVRTVYPFPRDRLDAVKGLARAVFPQEGQELPLKFGPKHRSTFLTSGDNLVPSPGKYGSAANAFAVQGNRIAIASLFALNRLAADVGPAAPIAPGGLSLEGPETSVIYKQGDKVLAAAPRSAAFSPDGKWLYLTGYPFAWGHTTMWFPCVLRVPYAADPLPARAKAGGGRTIPREMAPDVFVGKADVGAAGSKDAAFAVPTSVACDAQGRVYVADYMNDRIQVFTAEAEPVTSIKINKPTVIGVHPTTSEIYVASWIHRNRFIDEAVPAVFTRLGPLDDPTVRFTCPLPFNSYNPTLSWNRTGGLHYRVAFDFWSDPVRVWVLPGENRGYGGWGVFEFKTDLGGTGLSLFEERDGQLKLVRDFNTETTRKVVRAQPAVISRQRLYVDPTSGTLYVAEGDSGVMKSFRQLVRVDPLTGKIALVELPFTAEDLAIDINGLFYLRDDYHVVRYAPDTWKEVPFDYGEERPRVGFDVGARGAPAVAALALPSTGRMGWWHLGGMAVNTKGHLAVTCCNTETQRVFSDTDENPYAKRGHMPSFKMKYRPVVFPGRQVGWETHIFDDRGRVLHRDVLPGFTTTDGIGLDKDENVYVLSSALRASGEEPYFLPWTGTLVKVQPGRVKYASVSDRAPVPLSREGRPDKPHNVADGWIEGADWLYGGVGFVGARSGGSCICWNARPALDLFARSFVPEVDHFSVAVLDTHGNLILRLGKYGNVEDGKPLVAAGGPANPRGVGGDEVALAHAAYLGTHTDHRLFIADAGNQRILSVLLGYHATERVTLKDVPDRASRGE